MNRPTPETDAVAEKNIYGVACKVDVDFARKLERERDEAREEIEALRHEYHGAKAMAGGFKDKIKSLTEQREEAREAMREAWLACMRVDVRLALVEWRNKHASILEETK